MPLDSTSAGDSSRFQPLDHLRQMLGTITSPSTAGRLSAIVRRHAGGRRESLVHSSLTRASGVPGDAWERDPDRLVNAQLAVMETQVAELVANGQSFELFGDQLFVDLDLSLENLPTGSQLRVGTALLEVTPQPHNGCAKFRARFGDEALQFVSAKHLRHHNLRGIYLRVIEDGEATVGDPVTVALRMPIA